jgi:hypothetical protein
VLLTLPHFPATIARQVRGILVMSIVKSVAKYETWLRKQLHDDVFESDFAVKHQKMADGAFQFLRGTYWRWAETIYQACPELKSAPQVLAVGDIHVENFGTWRDADGRLVWGVNDFDEAARMPYAIDIVRLATSAVLAQVEDITPQAICDSIVAGYHEGIAEPGPFLLDRKNDQLRGVAIVSEDDRGKFWEKFDPEQIKLKNEKDKKKGKPPKVRPAIGMRPRYEKAMEWSRPDANVPFKYYERTAGTGSLGRPRYFGVGPWRGDLVVREAKAMLPSAWALEHHGSQDLRCEEIAWGRYRCPDPTYRLRGRVLVRRISPNDFKIEANAELDSPNAVKPAALVNAAMLQAMGHDLASIHRGTNDRRKAIEADLKQRGNGWLLAAVMAAQVKVEKDWGEWSAHYAKSDAGAKKTKKKIKKGKKSKKAKKAG